MELHSITFPGLPEPYKVAPGGYGYGGVVPNLYVPEYQTEANINAALEAELKTLGNQTAKQIQITYQDGTSMLGTLYRFDADHASFFGANYNGKIAHKYKSSGAWGVWREYTKEAFAPSGYGLGSLLATPKSDANSAVASGWYYLEPGATNSPNNTYYVAIRSDSLDGNSIVQTAYVLDSYFSKVVRRRTFGTWGAWEYENPPMALGVEYRTTERWNGKVVYKMALKIDALPNNTYQEYTHGKVVYPMSISLASPNQYVSLNGHRSITECKLSVRSFTIGTNADMSAFDAIATLTYAMG